MMPSMTRSSGRLWMGGAILMPLVIIGSLLGLTASADTALERIPVALVNNDELVTTTNDDGEEEFILASRPLITELITSETTSVDWVITSTEAANTLLASGEVYAVFEIPSDFSQAVSSLSTSDPRQATFTIRTDPTRSYLSGVVGDQLGDSIGKALSVEFAEQTTKGLFTVIVDLGDAFGEAADAAATISEGTTDLSDGINTLAKGMPELDEGATDLAEGYATFDTGLGDYTAGVTALSDGLDSLQVGTSSLGDLSAGVSDYTTGVSSLSSTLTSLNAYIASLPNSTGKSTLQVIEANLSTAASGGSTLSSETTTALSGITTGVREIDKGADALDLSGQEIMSASGEFRDATDTFANGITDLSTGVTDLNSGAAELAEGMDEFATGLSEGADEIQNAATTVPTAQALTALTSPVVFSSEDRSDAVTAQTSLASIIIPLGLWLVVLVTLLIAPRLSSHALTSTSRPARLVRTSVGPLLGIASVQALFALTLLHTLGGASWSTLGASAGVIIAGVFAFLSLHYLVWVWRSSWLPGLSIGFGVLQIASIGTLLPNEIFPAPYRLFEGLTPVSWFTDALLAGISGGDSARVIGGMVALVSVGALAMAVSVPLMKRRQTRELRSRLGLTPLPQLTSVGP
jgi:putative membrane protein